jgi:hypothetical protein
MADDAEYDSSDYDDLLPLDPVNEFATAGSRLAQSILNNQHEDRRITKQAHKSLQLDRGAPSTRRKLYMARTLLRCFMQSLGKQYVNHQRSFSPTLTSH